jgi:hypothetical protein
MRRPLLLLLALTLGLLSTGMSAPRAVADCDECADYCNTIPMDPGECTQLYCPGCATAGVGTVAGAHFAA